MKVTRHRVFSRFGLMHMIGTNLSVWLNVLIQETKHEILTFYNPENNTIEFNKQNAHYQHSKYILVSLSCCKNAPGWLHSSLRQEFRIIRNYIAYKHFFISLMVLFEPST